MFFSFLTCISSLYRLSPVTICPALWPPRTNACGRTCCPTLVTRVTSPVITPVSNRRRVTAAGTEEWAHEIKSPSTPQIHELTYITVKSHRDDSCPYPVALLLIYRRLHFITFTMRFITAWRRLNRLLSEMFEQQTFDKLSSSIILFNLQHHYHLIIKYKIPLESPVCHKVQNHQRT